MIAVGHCFAPQVGQAQRFPLPAPLVLCAERSILEVVPVRAWVAAITGEWLAIVRATTQLVAQPAIPESPQPWLSRLYARQPSGPSGSGGQVIGSSIFASGVFGATVIDRKPFDEEEG